MTALACQVVEPPGNLVHVGTEAAGVIQRKVAASVLFIVASAGVSNTVDANTPAIPWTSGFGSGDPIPTTPGTVDVATFAGRWVTFILAGADSTTQPMYVTQIYNWPQVAGPAGGRTVIPLDVWELHSWKYAGYEFLGSNVQEASGSKLCTVPASTDPTTHGDYGTVAVDFAADSLEGLAFPAGTVPVVVPGSYDMGWIASVDATSVDNAGCTLRVARRVPLTNPQTGSVSPTFPSGASSYVYPSNPISFPNAYNGSITPQPLVIAETDDPDFIAVASNITTTGFDLTLYYRPNASSGSVGDNSTGITVGGGASNIVSSGGPSDAYTDDPWTGTDPTHGAESPTTNTIAVHDHPVPDPSGWSPGTNTGTAGAHSHVHHHKHEHDHTHGVDLGTPDYPVTDPSHDHPFTGSTTLTGGSVLLTVVWESFGTRASPTVDVTVSFIARG